MHTYMMYMVNIIICTVMAFIYGALLVIYMRVSTLFVSFSYRDVMPYCAVYRQRRRDASHSSHVVTYYSYMYGLRKIMVMSKHIIAIFKRRQEHQYDERGLILHNYKKS